MSEEPVLLCSDRDGVRTLTLNRPRRKNAINRELWVALADALRRGRQRPRRARGGDHRRRGRVLLGRRHLDARTTVIPATSCSGSPTSRWRCTSCRCRPSPRSTGVAVGAGLEPGAGLRSGGRRHPESTFSQIFSKRGLSVDLGGSWLLPKIVGLQQAKRLVLLAETIDAAEAQALGLVTWVVAAAEIDAFVDDLADRLAAGPPFALAQSKALLNDGADRTLRDALANEARAQAGNFATADSAEAYAAFAEKREPTFTGQWAVKEIGAEQMRETVIVEAVRTPVGKRNGGLSDMHAADLSAVVLNELVERTGIDPDVVDDVVWGCVSQVGDQSSNIGRYAVLAAGWPERIPGTTINRACGSSQQALDFAVQAVMSGQQDVVVAGGVEVMSRVPLGSARATGMPYGPKVLARYDDFSFNQGLSAEMIAQEVGVLPHPARRVLRAVARAGRRRAGQRRFHRPDRPGLRRRRRGRRRRGHPARAPPSRSWPGSSPRSPTTA